MNKKILISVVVLLSLLLIAAIFLFTNRAPETEAEAPPDPAQNVSQLTPEGATNLRLFQVNFEGDEQNESVIIYTSADGSKHHLEVLQIANETWNKVAEKIISADQWKVEGVQRVDFNEDEKQEFFILLSNEAGDSKYFVMAHENGSFISVDMSEPKIILEENQTEAKFISFNAASEGIREIYAILCEGEEAPCGLDQYLVKYNAGKFTRQKIEMEIEMPAPEEPESELEIIE